MREIEARLKVSAVDKTGRVLQQVGGRLQSVNRQAAALNARHGAIVRATASVSAAMARYAAPAVVAAMTAGAVKSFAAIERQMTRIGITADASAKDTEDAFRRMQTISKEMALPLDSAISAVDTLVSSGLSLKEAMDFLPSVLATAQASGSATEDIANTAIKASSALKIQTSELQKAFDIMVSGGKAGQFELKDMSTYIPELANSFASLGYQGEGGLKTLIALLQTIREDTGSASAAATQAQNIFGKMFSEETEKRFSKFGVNLRKEMNAAKKNGEDAVAAFVRISKEALKGDLSKLPLLFSDQEFRLGMQSLITSTESFERFMRAVNSADVDGTVFRDLKRVTDDAQASLDRMASSWDRLLKSVGAAASDPAVAVMDAVSGDIDKGEAIRKALEEQGKGFWERERWIASELPFGPLSESDAADRMALKGGFVDDGIRAKFEQGPKVPEGWKSPSPEFPGGDRNLDPSNLPETDVPVPERKPARPVSLPSMPPALSGLPPELKPVEMPPLASMGQPMVSIPSKTEWKDALKIEIDPSRRLMGRSEKAPTAGHPAPQPNFPVPPADLPSPPTVWPEPPSWVREAPPKTVMGGQAGADAPGASVANKLRDILAVDSGGLAESSEQAAGKVADAGREAGKSIEDSAAFIRVAGYDVSTAIEAAFMAATQKLIEAAKSMNALGQYAGQGGSVGGRPPVNGNMGRSMPELDGGGGGY